MKIILTIIYCGACILLGIYLLHEDHQSAPGNQNFQNISQIQIDQTTKKSTDATTIKLNEHSTKPDSTLLKKSNFGQTNKIAKKNIGNFITFAVATSLIIFLIILLIRIIGDQIENKNFELEKEREREIEKKINRALDKDGFPKCVDRLLIVELLKETRETGDANGKTKREIEKMYKERGLEYED